MYICGMTTRANQTRAKGKPDQERGGNRASVKKRQKEGAAKRTSQNKTGINHKQEVKENRNPRY
jgi:hypothetical protein